MIAPLWKLARDVTAEALYSVGATRPTNARRLTIVTFHRVLTAEQLAQYPLPGIAVTPDELAWFLELFREHFECGALEPTHQRWVAQENLSRPLLAITFDDAQLDNFENARPVLDRAGVRATFFAPTEAVERGQLLWHDRAAYAVGALLRVDRTAARSAARALGADDGLGDAVLPGAVVRCLKRETAASRSAWIENAEASLGGSASPAWDGMMTFEQLSTLIAEGHEVGSHSHSHPILTATSDHDLLRELTESRALLERRLNRRITSLCYPNGDADDRVVRAAREAGYDRAVTTRWGWNPRGAEPFLLSRCDMTTSGARTHRGGLSRARVSWRLSGLYPGLG